MNYKEFTDNELLLEAYSYLDEVTPVKFNCGKLCSSLCCTDNAGNDEDAMGMWLLPGEKQILEGQDGYTFTKNESGTDCVVCNGVCNRHMRPFACRIYPYYASLKQLPDGRIMIKVKPDPRALISCPLVTGKGFRPSAGFRRALIRAVRILLERKSFRQELMEISSFLGEIEEMRKKFFENK